MQSDIVSTLSTEIPGKIISVSIKEGQKINAGDEIAQINVDTSTTGYQGGSAIVGSLQSMKSSITESFDTQILVAESQLKQAQIELAANQVALGDTQDIHEKQNLALESSLVVAEQNLALAETEKQEALKILATKEVNLYSNAKNALTGLMIIDTNLDTYIDEVFEVSEENAYKNDTYEDFL